MPIYASSQSYQAKRACIESENMNPTEEERMSQGPLQAAGINGNSFASLSCSSMSLIDSQQRLE